MSDACRTMQDVLVERLTVIQSISELTAEQLRLMQKHSGMQVLELVEGDVSQVVSDLGHSEKSLGECEAAIASLERRLEQLDQEIEAIALGDRND